MRMVPTAPTPAALTSSEAVFGEPPSRMPPVRTVVLALLIAAFAAASATAAGHPTAVPNCLGKPTVKPTSIILACADANFGVKKLTWIGWGGARAAS